MLDNRIELQNALDFVREGDTLLVTRLDRAFRSDLDSYKSLEILKNKKVEFQATDQEFDSTTSYGRMMMGMLSVMSKFWAKGKMSDEEVFEVMELQRKGEMINHQTADKFEVGRSTLLRCVAEEKQNNII